MFFLTGLLSFGMYLTLCPCTVSTVVPTIPALEAFLYVQIILHGIGLSMASTDGNKEQMTRVPQKNDVTTKYSFLRSVSSSICSHLIYLVALGELLWALDPTFVEEHCLLDDYTKERTPLAAIIRCQDLEQYSGISTIAAGSISLASLALCNTVLSASFVFRTESIRNEPPWKQNHQWVGSVVISVVLISVYLLGTLEREAMLVLPWYFYVMFVLCPFICLGISEMVKQSDAKQERRAAMMRRLQFETR
jgi:magnesium-transporting ATPase (P-type)